jgi:acetolactate synthase-1/2/3 large subunit
MTDQIRLADYVAQRCAEYGVRHIFLVTGGGAMHLNDAFARNKNLTPICFHHEQAAAMAAESYFRASNSIAVVNVTTGPGAINALNGVHGAYVDSLGMVVISGQVKRTTLSWNYDSLKARQLGDQEVNITSIARPIVKYAETIQDPLAIGKIMDFAFFLATFGRPGPVWIDIPNDVQSMKIDTSLLERWDGDISSLIDNPNIHENTKQELQELKSRSFDQEIAEILHKIKQAKRPVIFAGNGIRLSGQHDTFLKLISKLGIPVVTGWNAHDILAFDNPCYAGKPSTVGDRAGNFTVQNSDLLLILGSRLNIRQISYNWENFASKAYKIMIDVDLAELNKPTLTIDKKIQADLKEFMPCFLANVADWEIQEEHSNYLQWCKERVQKYPTVIPEYQNSPQGLINPYFFISELLNSLQPEDVVVTGNASAAIISFQTVKIKDGQRLYSNSGSASMGYDLPAAIGASIALNRQKIVCLTGDGSIMMNIQELQTIVGYKLPIKIVVLNNFGYLSIKQTQRNYFPDNVFGTCPNDGVSMPDFIALGTAFKLTCYKVTSIQDWRTEEAQQLLNSDQPVLFEVMCDPSQEFSPKLMSKRLADGSMLAPSLENMSPFLPEEEMAQNIIS